MSNYKFNGLNLWKEEDIMSKYYTTIPFFVVGEDEPRLAPMIDNLNPELIVLTPHWFVPSSHIDVRNIHDELDREAAAFILDEM